MPSGRGLLSVGVADWAGPTKPQVSAVMGCETGRLTGPCCLGRRRVRKKGQGWDEMDAGLIRCERLLAPAQPNIGRRPQSKATAGLEEQEGNSNTGANPTHINSNGEMGRKDPLLDHMVLLKQQFTDYKNRREEKFTRRN